MRAEKLSKIEHGIIFDACQGGISLDNGWQGLRTLTTGFSYQTCDSNGALYIVYIRDTQKYQHIFVGKKEVHGEERLGYDGMWRVGKNGKVIDLNGENKQQDDTEKIAVIALLRTLVREFQHSD